VTSSLLNHIGIQGITEPLAFGIGAGIFYIHIPFMKVNGGPAISFRTFPGAIFKRTCKALEIPIVHKKFRSEGKAMHYLDELLDNGNITGCQVGVYNLPYFPEAYRFHFNAHNIIIYGREGDQYLVSDPTMEITTTISRENLIKVRFAKGALAPKGHLYAPQKDFSGEIDIANAIRKGIKRNCRDVLKIPGSVAGVKGIGYTAKKIEGWRDKLGVRKAGLYLGQIIRMQEEIGTGGGGFRYIYAAFLEESYQYIKNDALLELSNEFTTAGDMWRNTAVEMAQVLKGKKTEQADFVAISDRMREIEIQEKKAFLKLKSLNLGK
jgi:hypothetical protein